MKFSEQWVREWVNPAVSTEQLCEQITMLGLEVDGVEAVAGTFNGVVVGEVVECAQHPDADKLRVTKVNVGGDRLLDIVCGAPNCRQGLKLLAQQKVRYYLAISKLRKRNYVVSHQRGCFVHFLN